jgi:hypothetical protein
MPASQNLIFAEGTEAAAKASAPPYLLNFVGSPAEQHIENTKVSRGFNSVIYN